MSKQNYIFDIEIFPNFFCCTFKKVNKERKEIFISYKDRLDFMKMIKFINVDVNYLIGYNNKKYDNLMLNYIYKNLDKLSKGWNGHSNTANNLLVNISQKIIQESNNLYLASDEVKQLSYGKWFKSIDLYNFVRVGQTGKSLKMCSVILKHNKVQDLPIYYLDKVKENQIPLVIEYNYNDILITEKLYNHVEKKILDRVQVGDLYNIDVIDASDSDMGFKIISKLYSEAIGQSFESFKQNRTFRSAINFCEIISPNIYFKTEIFKTHLAHIAKMGIYPQQVFTYYIPYKNNNYKVGEGGLHSQDIAGIWEEDEQYSIIDADVASFYPRIIINDRIKPLHCKEVLIDLVENLTKERLEAKKAKNITKAYSLKIAVNSVFGKYGYENGWLFDEQAMTSVTLNGELYLLMLIEKLEENKFEVISANTDGIITKVLKTRENEYYELCKTWELETRFELEYTYYSKYIRRDVNNYISIKKGFYDKIKVENKNKVEEEYIKTKGIFLTELDIQKGYNMPIISIALYNYFIYKDLISETIQKHQDIYDFCKAQKVGNEFTTQLLSIKDGELVKKNLQKTNRYYISTIGNTLIKSKSISDKKDKIHKIVKNEKVSILNDIKDDLPINEYNIDYKYYIKECYKIINKIIYKDLIIKKKTQKLKGIKENKPGFNQMSLF